VNLGIKGKVALITASSDGMGKNVAGALAAGKAPVFRAMRSVA